MSIDQLFKKAYSKHLQGKLDAAAKLYREILRIKPNHLDRHGTMQAYISAKARILAFQSQQDSAVLGREDPGAWSLAPQVKGRLISFGEARPPAGETGAFVKNDVFCYQAGKRVVELAPRSLLALRGRHNLLNALAACAVATAAGFNPAAIQVGFAGFTGVAHRLEFVRQFKGAAWYNDSIATAPERTIAAIQSFTEPLVLLLGGRDKNLPWEDLASLVHQRVDHVVDRQQEAHAMLLGFDQKLFRELDFVGLDQ